MILVEECLKLIIMDKHVKSPSSTGCMKSIFSGLIICSALFTVFSTAQITDDQLYSKSLLITDPEAIASLDPVLGNGRHEHFKSLITAFVGDQTKANTLMENWSNLWLTDQTSPCEASPPDTLCKANMSSARPDTGAALLEAWKNGNIELIGVISRVDLARFNDQKQVTDQGEFRLVYQLMTASPIGPVPQDFTLILEFGLPEIDGVDLNQSLKTWAGRWLALASAAPADYAGLLQKLVNEMVVTGKLKQIRTNESIPPAANAWEFRQFGFAENTLVQQDLPQNPMNSLRDWDDERILNMAKLHADQIVRGDFRFSDEVWGNYWGFSSNSTNGESIDPWLRNKGILANENPRGYLIMAANTCDGCHNEILNKTNQHIRRLLKENTMITNLSGFLSGEVELNYVFKGGKPMLGFAMPQCEDEARHPEWCSIRTEGNLKYYSWNEKLMRIKKLQFFAEPDNCAPQSIEKAANKKTADFYFAPDNFRYH